MNNPVQDSKPPVPDSIFNGQIKAKLSNSGHYKIFLGDELLGDLWKYTVVSARYQFVPTDAGQERRLGGFREVSSLKEAIRLIEYKLEMEPKIMDKFIPQGILTPDKRRIK